MMSIVPFRMSADMSLSQWIWNRCGELFSLLEAHGWPVAFKGEMIELLIVGQSSVAGVRMEPGTRLAVGVAGEEDEVAPEEEELVDDEEPVVEGLVC